MTQHSGEPPASSAVRRVATSQAGVGDLPPQATGKGKHRAPSRLSRFLGTSGPDARASLLFGVVTAVGAVAGILAVALLAIFHRPHAAVLVLGTGMVTMGLLRGLWPGNPWFSARNRWSDALVYTTIGALILWLSPWTALAPLG